MEKTKRGRPPKSPEERKAGVTGFRLNDEERTTLESAAELAGVKLSDWIRMRLLAAAKRELNRKSG